MNRKLFNKIITWDKEENQKPLLLTGAPGTGKTYLALELAKSFHSSYLYLNPRNDYKLRSSLVELSIQEQPDINDFLNRTYQIPKEWLNEFLVILDDSDYYAAIISLIEKLIIQPLNFKFIIISTQQPSKILADNTDVLKISPLQFDEYLKAIGSEWYTEIIQAHYQTKKKIPEIVHKEMLNLFRDYLRIGGMPAAINEFLHTESFDNIPTIHRNLFDLYHSEFTRYSESSIVRLKQLISSVPEQLLKENKNYRYNLIRKGATHNLYHSELRYLTELHLVNKIERANIKNDNGKLHMEMHANQFRLYPNDSGLLYSLILSTTQELSDETEEESTNTSHDKLFQLLSEAYLLQTLSQKNITTAYWESSSMAKLDFIGEFDSCIMPIEIKYYENKRSKSLHAFRQKYPVESYIKFSMQNFETNKQYTICPIYSLFCL